MTPPAWGEGGGVASRFEKRYPHRATAVGAAKHGVDDASPSSLKWLRAGGAVPAVHRAQRRGCLRHSSPNNNSSNYNNYYYYYYYYYDYYYYYYDVDYYYYNNFYYYLVLLP